MTSCLEAGDSTANGGLRSAFLRERRMQGIRNVRFDWVTILAAVTFVSIVVTLLLAVASYFAYKVRR